MGTPFSVIFSGPIIEKCKKVCTLAGANHHPTGQGETLRPLSQGSFWEFSSLTGKRLQQSKSFTRKGHKERWKGFDRAIKRQNRPKTVRVMAWTDRQTDGHFLENFLQQGSRLTSSRMTLELDTLPLWLVKSTANEKREISFVPFASHSSLMHKSDPSLFRQFLQLYWKF